MNEQPAEPSEKEIEIEDLEVTHEHSENVSGGATLQLGKMPAQPKETDLKYP